MASPSRAAADRDETEKERLDRNLGELLQELRVALPGVQVLFAFLLVVPFNPGYSRMSAFDTATTVVATAATLLAFAAVWYGLPLSRRGPRGR